MGNDLAAAVLVGGRSRRMGTNKALIRLRDGGPTVVESVIATLLQVVDDVMLVGCSEISSPGTRKVSDLVAEAGVLGGIHGALRASNASHVLVVGCDMPFLNVDVLRFMIDETGDSDVVVLGHDQPQPLHSIYGRACLPMIERQMGMGDFKASGWFEQAVMRSISPAELRRFDPEMLSSFNMNTPEDLAFARRRVAEMAVATASRMSMDG